MSYFKQDHHAVQVCRWSVWQQTQRGNSHLHPKHYLWPTDQVPQPCSKTETEIHKTSFFPSASRLPQAFRSTIVIETWLRNIWFALLLVFTIVACFPVPPLGFNTFIQKNVMHTASCGMLPKLLGFPQYEEVHLTISVFNPSRNIPCFFSAVPGGMQSSIAVVFTF